MKPYSITTLEGGHFDGQFAITTKDGLIIGVVRARGSAERILKELNDLHSRLEEVASLVKGI